MSVKSEGIRVGDWLKGEAQDPTDYSRATITVLAAESPTTGMVLGKITASGKFVQLDPDASDGSQAAAGILVTDVVDGTTIADNEAVAIVRQAVVSRNRIVWPGGISDPDKATAIVELAALGIIVREGA